jgi:hypothetical protein
MIETRDTKGWLCLNSLFPNLTTRWRGENEVTALRQFPTMDRSSHQEVTERLGW